MTLKAFEIDLKKLDNSMIEHNSIYRLPTTKAERECKKHGLSIHFLNLKNNEYVCTKCEQEQINERTTFLASQKARKTKSDYHEKRKKDYIKKSFVKESYFKKSFDNYRVNGKTELITVYQQTRALTERILKGEQLNVVLVGGCGCGKSHLAMSMVTAINNFSSEYNKQLSCLAVNFDELIRKIRESYTDGTNKEQKYIDMLVNADILLLDDIGAETKKSEFNTRIMFAILERRAEEKTTIFTTNNSMSELTKLYDARCTSRMSSNLVLVNFNNIRDYRPHMFAKKGL